MTVVLSAARFLPVLLTGEGLGQLHDRPFLDVLPVPLLSSEPAGVRRLRGRAAGLAASGGEESPSLDAAGLRDFAEPGWVKAAMDFRLTPRGNGTELSSETRVLSTDDATRRRFACYWLFVQPGSTAIRWEVLTAVAAEGRGRRPVELSRLGRRGLAAVERRMRTCPRHLGRVTWRSAQCHERTEAAATFTGDWQLDRGMDGQGRGYLASARNPRTAGALE